MQQINFYIPALQPNREPWRSVHMLWALLALVVLLLLFSFYSHTANRAEAEALSQARTALEQRKLELIALEQLRPQNNLAALDSELLRLQTGLERREQILNVIANKKLGNNTGYSGHLNALASQSLETVSLSAFSILEGGSYAEFMGQARAPDQVPLYLQRLRSQPQFAQTAFGILELEPADNSAAFNFSLAKERKKQRQEKQKTAVQMLLELNAKSANSISGGAN